MLIVLNDVEYLDSRTLKIQNDRCIVLRLKCRLERNRMRGMICILEYTSLLMGTFLNLNLSREIQQQNFLTLKQRIYNNGSLLWVGLAPFATHFVHTSGLHVDPFPAFSTDRKPHMLLEKTYLSSLCIFLFESCVKKNTLDNRAM